MRPSLNSPLSIDDNTLFIPNFGVIERTLENDQTLEIVVFSQSLNINYNVVSINQEFFPSIYSAYYNRPTKVTVVVAHILAL